MPDTDYISLDDARTLYGLFRERLRRSRGDTAYLAWEPAAERWQALTWAAVAREVARWQGALGGSGLQPGDRVAILAPNGPAWVAFDLAALGLGLVTVPLYVEDHPGNTRHVLEDSGSRLLFLGAPGRWPDLAGHLGDLGSLERIVVPQRPEGPEDPRLVVLGDWLGDGDAAPAEGAAGPGDLASIVYTSGTTGRPKGVMLSHHNILWNAWAGARCVPIYPSDRFLSFLPLSHTLERTVGYYIPMLAGAQVAFARSIPQLSDDLLQHRPTMLISVPRIFERVAARLEEQLAGRPAFARRLFRLGVDVGWQHFLYRQGRGPWRPALLLQPLLDALVGRKVRARLGGRLRYSVCGGAPLPPAIARLFIGLGVEILQGYGLTETSPTLTVNRPERNIPESVGEPLPDVELRLGEEDELLARSPGVMQGYWQQPEATAAMIDGDGWLHTGDQAAIEDHHVYITGRLKEIIVLSNGEKVPPADMEAAIVEDPAIEQAMIIGEGRPCLAALVVLAEGARDTEADLLERIQRRLIDFPGYARVRAVAICPEPWTVENGLLTPTMKLKRHAILRRYHDLVEELYAAR